MLLAVMVTPIILVILFSFGNNAMIGFPLGRLTWHWYGDLFAWLPFRSALRNSLTVASIVGLVSTCIGTGAAVGLSRMHRLHAEPIGLALCFPMMLPGLVIGIALLSFYVSVGVPPSLLTVILSHLVCSASRNETSRCDSPSARACAAATAGWMTFLVPLEARESGPIPHVA